MATAARTIAHQPDAFRPDISISAPTLSALEWKVVSLAMREANEFGGGTSWLGRLFHRATGIAPKLPLADPRLETLRRFVSRVRSRADVSDLVNSLQDLGYNHSQITAVAMLAR